MLATAARLVIQRFLARLRDDLGESPEADFSQYAGGDAYLTRAGSVK